MFKNALQLYLSYYQRENITVNCTTEENFNFPDIAWKIN